MNNPSPLSREIVQFLRERGIVTPTPIQERAIPLLLRGDQNALLLAPTGSGKTEAALLPLLNRLYILSKEKELFGFYILYITPLKALNRDVFKRITDLCQYLGISVDVRHGDTSQYARRKQAIRPPNLLITTPETLQAILPGKRLSYHLRTVFGVIIDEVHDLASSKRGTQLSLGLERLGYLVGSKILRIGLSATVGNPGEVAQLLGGRENVNTIWAGYEKRRIDLQVEMPEPDPHHSDLARRLSYPPHSLARLETIVNLIDTHQSTLVFTNTRSFAEVLGAKMRAFNPPYDFDVHHGSLSKDVRLSAEDRLKTGISKAIIATSSLELGIDIGQADLVIQYSSPREVSRLLQRVGRSGHGVGRTSKGIVISTMNLDDITESGVIVRRAKMNKVENARIPKRPWDVLSHQIAGILLDSDEIEKSILQEMITRAHPYRDVSTQELGILLDFMHRRELIEVIDSRVCKGKRTRLFYYDRLSMIPDIKQVNAVDITTRTSIGVLDEDYVSANVEAGSVFVIRGRSWNVVSIDDETGEVLCAPITSTDTEAPRWIGEMIPVPYEVATEVSKVWNEIIARSVEGVESWLHHEYGISKTAQEYMMVSLTQSKEILGTLPSENRFILESFGTGLVLHSPLGTRTNETLGIVISALMTTRLGFTVAVETDPYRILFTATENLEPTHVVDVLQEYSGEQAAHILRLAIRHTQNFASRFVHVGRRMDIIRKDAKSKQIPVKWLIKSFEETPVFEEAMREVLEEKMDETGMKRIFDEVSEGMLEIVVVKTDIPSPLARLIIEEKTRFEVMGEITEEDEVLRMMEERLLSKQFRLFCMAKGHWNSVRTVSTLNDAIECPVCGSKMIAVLSVAETDFGKTLARHIRGEDLSKEEKKTYRDAALTAELVSRYGKRALLVLAGRGIGARTASRILQPELKERLEILRAIAKGELEYERTRPYW